MGFIAGPVAQPIVRPVVGGWRTLSRRFADILKNRTAIAYNPQDLTTMYQDAAGTLPVYRPGSGAVDPPVGLLLDKSGGGHHASQNTTTARPTLSGRYNLLTATETISTQSVTTAATDYTLRFEGTGSITLSGTATGTYSAGTHTITCTAGSLTLTVAGSVTKADLRVKRDGSSLPPYQRVDSATTYDTVGFPLYLQRDKVDDDLIVQAPAITGVSAWGAAEGSLFGKVNIAAGEYKPLGVITEGLTTCTQWIAVDGTLSAAETAVLERFVASKSRTTYDVTTADPVVFQFDLTSVSTFNFILLTKSGLPVLVDWGDGNTTAYAGTDDQVATKTYAASGTYTVKVYAKGDSVLTKFRTTDAGMSGTLSLPSGMTTFSCTGSNTLSGTLSLPSKMTTFSCTGSNTLSGTLSLPIGMTSFYCTGSNTLSGTLSLPSKMTTFSCTGSNTLSCTLSLPSKMTTFICTGSNTLSGTLSLPSGMTYLNCSGSNTLSGTLSLPTGMTFFSCTGSNTLSGTLSLPIGMTSFYCTGSNTLSGTLSLPSKMTYFSCDGSNTLSGYTPSAKASNQQRFYLAGANTLSATDVDNILIDYAAAGGTWADQKEVTIQGNAANRTSASDAAYASLAAKLATLSVD